MLKLHTERLTLRPCTPGDIDRLHALWTDPDVRRWLWDDRVIERHEVEALVEESAESFRRHSRGLWMIDRDDRNIGFCGLREASDWMPGDIELIYGLDPKYWGHGYATEASIELLGLAFGELGLEHVLAAVDAPNVGSVRVLDRLGMHFDRDGYIGALPTKFFSLTKDAFLKGRGGG